MSRLMDYLYPDEELEVGDMSDVRLLKSKIPEIAHVPAPLVAQMYSDYSDMFAASWLHLDADTIESFKEWLL